MLTSPARRIQDRRTALTAAAALTFLGAGALLVGHSQATPKLFEFTTQVYEWGGVQKVMYCIPMSHWMETVLNDMVGDVVADIVHQPRLARIPLEAEMDVGPVR
jgi:hypothetical protein